MDTDVVGSWRWCCRCVGVKEMLLQMYWGQGDGLTDVLGSRRWHYRCVGVKEMVLQMCWSQGDGLTQVSWSRRWSYRHAGVNEIVLQMCWGQGDGLTEVLGSRRWSYTCVGVKEMVTFTFRQDSSNGIMMITTQGTRQAVTVQSKVRTSTEIQPVLNLGPTRLGSIKRNTVTTKLAST